MDQLLHLAFLRKHYLHLTKLFYSEMKRGKTVRQLDSLRKQIDEVIAETKKLERELNISSGTRPLKKF